MSDYRVAILTVSDRGAKGEREDLSGRTAQDVVEEQGWMVEARDIVPDEVEVIADRLRYYCDELAVNLVLTSGGTGLSPRDVTPQAMREIVDYEIPGMAEAMRAASLVKTPHAMLSRAMAGVRQGCLIINLPGSPGGARDNLSVVLPALNHAISKLAGDPSDCGTGASAPAADG